MCRIVEGTLRSWALPRRLCMWVLKKNLLGLALVVGAVFPSFAATVAPLYFESLGASFDENSDEQQVYWERLMKYKLWGTHSLNFTNQKVSIGDNIGYNGTADGNVVFNYPHHHIGGPTLVGGNLSFNAGSPDSITAGPVRILGNLTVSLQNNNVMEGDWCVQGTISGQYDGNLVAWNNLLNGAVYNNTYTLSKKAGTYAQCPTTVPQVNTELKVPIWPAPAKMDTSINMTSCYGGEKFFIHVPPDTVQTNEYGTYDLYIDQMNVSCTNNKTLYIVMPPKGKLTRIYSKNGYVFSNAANDLRIQVLTVQNGVEYNRTTKQWQLGQTYDASKGFWTGEDNSKLNYVDNKTYGGNVLFYTPKDIKWDYWVDANFQGSWISTGKITIGGHFKLAGQVIANNLDFQADVSGDFRYVPFDPPQIGLNLASNQKISENDSLEAVASAGSYTGTSLNIELDKAPETNVEFDYCFLISGTAANFGSNNANFYDIDTAATHIPICGRDTVYAARIYKGETQLRAADEIKVWIHDDKDVENREFFNLRIFNMVGGVFPDGSRDRTVPFQILDNDGSASPCNVDSKNSRFSLPEDASIILSGTAFPALCSDATVLPVYNVHIKTLPLKGKLYLGANEVHANDVIASGNLPQLKYVPARDSNGVPMDSIKFQVEDEDEHVLTAIYTVTLDVTPANDCPYAEGFTVDVRENAPIDSIIATVVGTDADATTRKPGEYYTLTYTIMDGNANDAHGNPSFAINSSSGKISIKGELDFEHIDRFPLVVRVSDNASPGLYKDIIVVVNILDENEPPVAVNCTGSVKENSLINTYTNCHIAANDPENTTLKYEITGGEGKELFRIDNQGDIWTDGAIDYESLPAGAKYYTLTVTVKDKNGASGYKSSTATATITVTNVDEAPVVVSDTCWIKENTKTPFYAKDQKTTKTCQVPSTDPEGKGLTYTITEGNTNTTFAVDAYGVITASKAPNYENTHDFSLVVSVSDGVNTTKTLALIHVIDVNEAPTAENTTCTIAENSPINLVTPCWIKASDQDGDALSYSITSATQNGADYFRVDENGNIVVKDVIDYDALSSDKFFVLTVTISDGRGKTKTATATVNITDEDENPVVKADTCWIKENSKTPFYAKDQKTTKTCQVTSTDPEGKSLTYAIASGNANGTFAVSSSGVITASKAPDFETTSEFKLIIDVSDGVNTVKTLALIHVIDVNEPPVAKVEDASVEENSPVNTYVTWVEASDIEDKLKLTYKIVGGNDNDVFKITSSGLGNNDDGEIRVAKDALDFETKSSYTLSIQVCDLGTPGTAADILCVTKSVTIKVTDGNEKPSITGFPDKVIDEHTPVGTEIGTVTGTDPENGELTYSFAGGNNGQAFAIDPSTGVITVARDIDFEALTDTVFKIKVIVKDAGGLRDETMVNIAIRDINEGPQIDDATMTVAENQPKGTTVGTLELFDPDKKPENRQNTYQAIGGDKDLFTIDSKTGEIKTNAVFDYEAKTSYSLVVRVYDQDGHEDTATVKINIADIKESSNIVVTYAETGSGAENWTNPVGTLYTNENSMLLQWTADGKPMPDTLLTNLKEGYNIITLTYTDPTKNTGVTETVGIFVSTRTPEVTVTTSAEQNKGGNIYTLVEKPAEGDTSVYVNKKNNDIVITIKEPVIDETYSDSTCNYESHTFTVNTELEPVTIPSATYDVVNKVVAAGPVLNDNPASEVTYSQFNKDQVKVSYTEKIAGVDVTISYVTDKDGNVEKIPVVGANGKIDSIEVITVSYQVNVGGKVVNVSYVADAITGQALKTTTVNNSNTASNTGSKPGSNSGSNNGSKPGSNSGSNNGSSGNGGSGNANSGTGNAAPVYMYSLTEGEVLYSVTYDFTTKVKGMGETTVQVSYTVDQKGNVTKDKDGNVGYSVSYTYVNEMGNSSTQSVYIVVDLVPPKVIIKSPENESVLHSNMVEVEWYVDLGDGRGPIRQDSLKFEGLQPGEVNEIVRFYRDKAGNEASDVVYVMAKNTKDVDISVEKPVTVITKEEVDKYYASKEPEKGQSFAISIYNPQTDQEVETQVGGSFKNKNAANESVYPGLSGHLGPTLGIQAKVPVINSVDGLATLDDLVGADGMILLDAVDAVGSKKVSVDEFVAEHCDADFKAELGSDISKANIYDTKMSAKIWVYTSLGQFVDYFSFTQELNDPSYASDAGVLTMYFEQKPDRNGDVHTANGRLYATGAYVYKTEITMKSKLRCDLPPFDDATNANKLGQTKKVKEDLLKSFGYKRPTSK